MFEFKRLLAAVLCFAATPALSLDHWTVTDLGSARTESLCVETASETFVSFSQIYGASQVLKANWTVYGYGLNNGNHDAVVTCAFATANATRATLIVYSDNTVTGGLISRRLAERFEQLNARNEAEWLDKAYKRFGF